MSINAKGGFLEKHRIRLFARDTQTEPEAAKQVVSDLISNDGVRAVIGTYSSATSLAVKPIVRQTTCFKSQPSAIRRISPSLTPVLIPIRWSPTLICCRKRLSSAWPNWPKRITGPNMPLLPPTMPGVVQPGGPSRPF